MASKTTDSNTPCLVCFKPQDELKTVGECKHRFCTTCLMRHLEGQEGTGDTFFCPICDRESSLGCDTEGDLTVVSGYKVTGDIAGADPTIKGKDVAERKRDQSMAMGNLYEIAMKCQICCHSGKEEQAASLCVKCDHLYMCQDCTSTHRGNRATREHVLVPLMSESSEETSEELCSKHYAPLTRYCCQCDQPVCKICVQLNHGDHELQTMGEVVQYKVEEVKVALGERELVLKRLNDYHDLLTKLETAASNLDKPDNLMKEIEDHSEKCINHIIKLKQAMKAEVKARFEAGEEVRKDARAALAAVSETIGKLQLPFAMATKLVSAVAQPTPRQLDQLSKAQSSLGETVPAFDITDAKIYHERIFRLLSRNHTFLAVELPNFGKLKETVTQTKLPTLPILKQKIPADSKDKFIPCVANLGNTYAVAHPGNKGLPSVAVDIYEFPGKLKLTLKDGIGPVRDMASTPDGKLAVLTDCSEVPSSCTVKVFDPNTGKETSSCNLHRPTPLSLGVNFQNQYVILSDKEQGKKLITIIDGNGSIELEHELMSQTPKRVTCGFKYIFVMGQMEIVVYEVKDKDLIQLSNITQHVDFPMDISATFWDHLFLTDVLNKVYMIQCIEVNTGQWRNDFTTVNAQPTAEEKESRISSDGHHTIMTWGQTFTVYQH